MNLEQLEKLRRGVILMRGTIEEENQGSSPINEALDELEKKVNYELKNRIWQRYLEAEAE